MCSIRDETSLLQSTLMDRDLEMERMQSEIVDARQSHGVDEFNCFDPDYREMQELKRKIVELDANNRTFVDAEHCARE